MNTWKSDMANVAGSGSGAAGGGARGDGVAGGARGGGMPGSGESEWTPLLSTNSSRNNDFNRKPSFPSANEQTPYFRTPKTSIASSECVASNIHASSAMIAAVGDRVSDLKESESVSFHNMNATRDDIDSDAQPRYEENCSCEATDVGTHNTMRTNIIARFGDQHTTSANIPTHHDHAEQVAGFGSQEEQQSIHFGGGEGADGHAEHAAGFDSQTEPATSFGRHAAQAAGFHRRIEQAAGFGTDDEQVRGLNSHETESADMAATNQAHDLGRDVAISSHPDSSDLSPRNTDVQQDLVLLNTDNNDATSCNNNARRQTLDRDQWHSACVSLSRYLNALETNPSETHDSERSAQPNNSEDTNITNVQMATNSLSREFCTARPVANLSIVPESNPAITFTSAPTPSQSNAENTSNYMQRMAGAQSNQNVGTVIRSQGFLNHGSTHTQPDISFGGAVGVATNADLNHHNGKKLYFHCAMICCHYLCDKARNLKGNWVYFGVGFGALDVFAPLTHSSTTII